MPPELSGCCDERAGLLVHDSEVMLDRVDMRGGAPGRAHLPGDQLGERLGDDREGLGSSREASCEAVANR